MEDLTGNHKDRVLAVLDVGITMLLAPLGRAPTLKEWEEEIENVMGPEESCSVEDALEGIIRRAQETNNENAEFQFQELLDRVKEEEPNAKD